MTSRIGWAAVLVALATVAGCSERAAGPDAATSPDAATDRDVGIDATRPADAATLPDAATLHDAASNHDAATNHDAGSDAFVVGHDAFVSPSDANVDAFCSLPPPPCAAPPPGCHYDMPGCGTCGTIVCTVADCSPACDLSSYCDHCGSALTCTPRPTPMVGVCPDVFNPVCGCDGMTYSNSCELGLAMIPEWHAGACDGTGAL